MPLFMDLHISPTGDIPIDELIEKHKADLAIQLKYGVEFKRMWVNKEKGMVFCLMEGPDKEACSCVHQEAHGDNGCNVIEVSGSDYDKFLSDSITNKHDIAETEMGLIDTAYRSILWLGVINPLDRRWLSVHKVKHLIKKNRGTLLLDPQHSLMAVFLYPSEAFRCAEQIKKFADNEQVDHKMAIVSGKPVEKNHDKFYGYAIDLCNKISISDRKGSISTTQLTVDLLKKEGTHKINILKNTDVLSLPDEQFLNRLINLIQKNFRNPAFSVKQLSQNLGISRTQLYRKITSVTGRSPNDFIRNVKMKRAFSLIREKEFNISEVALKVGYNNPSYFSKCFREIYGVTPSQILAG